MILTQLISLVKRITRMPTFLTLHYVFLILAVIFAHVLSKFFPFFLCREYMRGI